jgi:hypothetical protein
MIICFSRQEKDPGRSNGTYLQAPFTRTTSPAIRVLTDETRRLQHARRGLLAPGTRRKPLDTRWTINRRYWHLGIGTS